MTSTITTITAILKETHMLTRYRCGICGGMTNKQDIIPWFDYPEGDGGKYICDGCLEAGADAAPARLLAWAEQLEADALELRALAESRFVLPSLSTARAAEDEYCRRVYGLEPTAERDDARVKPARADRE
jgi:hypothetical protein